MSRSEFQQRNDAWFVIGIFAKNALTDEYESTPCRYFKPMTPPTQWPETLDKAPRFTYDQCHHWYKRLTTPGDTLYLPGEWKITGYIAPIREEIS